jgi:hypothetical protein
MQSLSLYLLFSFFFGTLKRERVETEEKWFIVHWKWKFVVFPFFVRLFMLETINFVIEWSEMGEGWSEGDDKGKRVLLARRLNLK